MNPVPKIPQKSAQISSAPRRVFGNGRKLHDSCARFQSGGLGRFPAGKASEDRRLVMDRNLEARCASIKYSQSSSRFFTCLAFSIDTFSRERNQISSYYSFAFPKDSVLLRGVRVEC